ncbi:MAG: DUF3473 domain-containing protein [Phycisphaerales bacterium]|nr:DUF3473 domain-containing protein [Phycisphaerales bacterium]
MARFKGVEATSASVRVCHAFTVDVEDWQQSVLDHGLPVSDRFVAPTRRIAELLDRAGVRATFFVLGNAAVRSPGLIRELADAGHEVQIHGFDHRLVHGMTPAQFREDVRRTKAIVEDITGREVFGYRAPRFSIDERNLWALDVLAECGIRYDSSIFPMRVRGYGVAGWFSAPHRVRTAAGAELIEVPVACGELAGRRVPLGGGGYFRLLPLPFIRRRLMVLEAAGTPAVLYCHPHEFDADALRELPVPIPLATRLHQGLGRRGFPRKIAALLRAFRFGPIRELIGL